VLVQFAAFLPPKETAHKFLTAILAPSFCIGIAAYDEDQGMPRSLSIVGTVISAVGVVALYGCVAAALSAVLLLWVL
jgi:hypothetical protein